MSILENWEEDTFKRANSCSPISAYEKNIIENRCREVLNNNYVKEVINEACENIMHEYFKRLKITDYIYEEKFEHPTIEKVRCDMQKSIQEVVYVVHKFGLDSDKDSIERMISVQSVLNAIACFEKAVIDRLRKDRNAQVYFLVEDVVRIYG